MSPTPAPIVSLLAPPRAWERFRRAPRVRVGEYALARRAFITPDSSRRSRKWAVFLVNRSASFHGLVQILFFGRYVWVPEKDLLPVPTAEQFDRLTAQARREPRQSGAARTVVLE